MIEVPIPGGTAYFRDKDELKIRQRRQVEIASFAASRVLDKLPKGIDKMSDEDRAAAIVDIALTPVEFEVLNTLQDVIVLALLHSWTLTDPVPTTVEQLGEIPSAVYDALSEASRKPGSALVIQNLAPDPDPNSPTQPSGVSVTA